MVAKLKAGRKLEAVEQRFFDLVRQHPGQVTPGNYSESVLESYSFSWVLSETERKIVDDYFRWKWGL